MTFLKFEQPELLDRLERLTEGELDLLPFGVIGIDRENIVRRYNAVESQLAVVSPQNALERNLFTHVAPCMNNMMVAQRFEDASVFGQELDHILDYVLTLRMRPKRVRLRLLSREAVATRYILVQPLQ